MVCAFEIYKDDGDGSGTHLERLALSQTCIVNFLLLSKHDSTIWYNILNLAQWSSRVFTTKDSIFLIDKLSHMNYTTSRLDQICEHYHSVKFVDTTYGVAKDKVDDIHDQRS